MPLDGNMGYQSHAFEEAFLLRARWTLKFVWWPKRCILSNRRIWLEHAYCGVAVWMGPGSDVIEIKWAESTEYLIWSLKR